ncbi:MAG: hypothetical protein LBQ05_00330 [Christensenellaceae bacterium]|jgi:hypothetical protein|nr:hypothetical protein [Christensenellaceae bacterium]
MEKKSEFVLMHKDISVAMLDHNKLPVQIITPEHVPYNFVRANDKCKFYENIIDLVLSYCNCNYATPEHTFWIKYKNSPQKYSDVSPYANGKKFIKINDSYSVVDGKLARRKLCGVSYANAEVIGTIIGESLRIPVAKNFSHGAFVDSQLFTDENTEMYTQQDLEHYGTSDKINDKTNDENNILKPFGKVMQRGVTLQQVKNMLAQAIPFHSLLGLIDTHKGNLGWLADVNTNKIISHSPFYDFEMSLTIGDNRWYNNRFIMPCVDNTKYLCKEKFDEMQDAEIDAAGVWDNGKDGLDVAYPKLYKVLRGANFDKKYAQKVVDNIKQNAENLDNFFHGKV